MTTLFGSQGILLVYDITNGWSFDGIDRWIREIDEVNPTLRLIKFNCIQLGCDSHIPVPGFLFPHCLYASFSSKLCVCQR